MPKATLTKRLEFCSSHRYHNLDWDDAKNREVFGACNNANTHGHNYLLEVTLCGEIDPVTGMIINLYDLKQHLWDVLIEFDHKNLNLDTPYFTNRIPTTENLALTLWNLLEKHPQLPDLDRIRLYEDETLYAEVTRQALEKSNNFPTALHADITRNYHFSSAVNNPNGQTTGHNYAIGISITGPIDSETGQIINLGKLDQLIQTTIINRLSNKNMSFDPDFKNSPPTEEMLASFIWKTLAGNIPQGTLAQVTVSQNSGTAATYRA
jgi:6-pyruvoyltetrahydropterin/6-carboxytetrahydropterin synthase